MRVGPNKSILSFVCLIIIIKKILAEGIDHTTEDLKTQPKSGHDNLKPAPKIDLSNVEILEILKRKLSAQSLKSNDQMDSIKRSVKSESSTEKTIPSTQTRFKFIPSPGPVRATTKTKIQKSSENNLDSFHNLKYNSLIRPNAFHNSCQHSKTLNTLNADSLDSPFHVKYNKPISTRQYNHLKQDMLSSSLRPEVTRFNGRRLVQPAKYVDHTNQKSSIGSSDLATSTLNNKGRLLKYIFGNSL